VAPRLPSAVVGTLLLASSTIALAQPPASPQRVPDPPSLAVEARTFPPEYFARFAPRTALDMVRQVPGLILQQADERRGFGDSSGNVLINGRRASGKSNDALSELGRIPARSVIRIEILDGAILNVPGLSGQVVNVIAKPRGLKGQFAWRPEYAAIDSSPLWSRGELSISGTSGALDYTAGLRNDAYRRTADGPTVIRDSAGRVTDLRDERAQAIMDRPKVSGSIKYDGPGGSLGNLNLSYGRVRWAGSELSDRQSPEEVNRFRSVQSKENGFSYEVGGDYELGFGPGRLKLIALHRFGHVPFTSEAITRFADHRPPSGNRFARTADEAETIGRAEYRWGTGPGNWQLSAEGAFNSLDSDSSLFVLLPNGTFREIPLPGGTAKGSESRGETKLSYRRSLSRQLSMQASLGAEYSRLQVEGPGGSARSFVRPKGFVSAAWQPAPGTALSGKLERKVGQLSFVDFLASENLSTENRNVGNPDLVPSQSWDLEVSAARSFGPWGSATLRVFGRLLEDVVDIVPIGDHGESPGNLRRGHALGLEAKGTLLFDRLGWRGARLDARGQFQASSVQDPLTRVLRQVSGNQVRLVELSLRHDLPRTEWAWGATASHVRASRTFRLGEVSQSYEGPVFFNLFAERKNLLGATVRGTLANLLGAQQVMDRTTFVNRRTGPVAFQERRRRGIGPIFSLSLSGSF
jgi:outer membrane receptor for ferrienterochelin and colicins